MILDLRLERGRVLTMDPARHVAHTIGIWRGRIVGLDDEVADLPTARVIDLDGATVLPGFIDAHTHLAWAGMAEAAVDVSACTSVDQVLEVIGSAGRAGSGWLEVAAYDHRSLQRQLTAQDLDRVCGDRLVYVQDKSGHSCVVSSAVLARLPQLVAGSPGVALDADGRPTGGLAEGAQSVAKALRLPYSIEEVAAAVERSARRCLAEGVVMCAEAGIGGGLIGGSPVEAAAYQLAVDSGRLSMRVQLMAFADVLRPVDAHASDGIPRAASLGLRTGLGDDRLSLGALKLWLDGGMMARTAALTEPYRGVGGEGQLQADPDILTATIVDGHAAGWQLAIHAIGDRAIDLALDALAEAERGCPRPGARHRIEHCGLARPDQLDRLAAARVIPVVQPSFLWENGDDYTTIMGNNRAGWLYRGRSFLDRGLILAGSSDRPVATGAPLRAIQFMVERRSSSGLLVGAPEAITVHEALTAYTLGAAHACHREHTLGTLTAGKLADLVILADDPHRVDVSRIAEIEVLATMVDGTLVHDTVGFG